MLLPSKIVSCRSVFALLVLPVIVGLGSDVSTSDTVSACTVSVPVATDEPPAPSVAVAVIPKIPADTPLSDSVHPCSLTVSAASPVCDDTS